jgi:hypothetical protein
MNLSKSGLKSDRWNPDRLDGKPITWKVVHPGTLKPAIHGYIDAFLSAKLEEGGMMVKIIMGDGETELDLRQEQLDSLHEKEGRFYLD